MEQLTVKKFLLKKYPTSQYMDCPVPKHHWEVMQEYAEVYHESIQKERDKQIASLAWDAALNRDMEEREYPYGKRTPFVCPDKDTYLSSLTK